MPPAPEIFDLTRTPPARVQSAAFYALKGLARGGKVILLLAQDPALLMQSLDLQLRHILAWTVTESEGCWRVEVTHGAERPPQDVLEVLARDHRRLDGLFIQVMRLANTGEVSAAVPVLYEFAAGLRQHMQVEDDMLATVFALPGERRGPDPLSIMLREHAELRRQLAAIEECLAAPDAAELGALCAILSGMLAKHEHREEETLFPVWRAAWAQKPEAEREELMSQVAAMLAANPKDER